MAATRTITQLIDIPATAPAEIEDPRDDESLELLEDPPRVSELSDGAPRCVAPGAAGSGSPRPPVAEAPRATGVARRLLGMSVPLDSHKPVRPDEETG